MTVSLRDCVSMSGMLKRALAIGSENSRVSVRVICFEPTQQRGTKVETKVRVVVDGALFAVRRINYTSEGVGPIALGMNPLVPIMERGGARVGFDNSGPRIFTWRLIEVAVNYEKGHRGQGVGYSVDLSFRIRLVNIRPISEL